MPVTHDPVYAQGIREVNAVVTAANTDYAAPTGAVKLMDAGPNGSMLYGLHAMPLATLGTASKLQFYKSGDAAGTVKRLSDSALMAAHTVASTTVTPKTVFVDITDDTPKFLEPGGSFWVASAQALAAGIAFSGRVQDL